MKQTLKSSEVTYNPKTDEYTVENDLRFIGFLHGVKIYAEKCDYGDLMLIENYLSMRK